MVQLERVGVGRGGGLGVVVLELLLGDLLFEQVLLLLQEGWLGDGGLVDNDVLLLLLVLLEQSLLLLLLLLLLDLG